MAEIKNTCKETPAPKARCFMSFALLTTFLWTGISHGLEADPPQQTAYLKASNTDAGDRFGRIAISGDTLVAGAGNEDSNATGINGDQSNNSAGDAGAVYVFVRDGMTWSQQAYLKASNTDATDYFGSVAISGDTLVVGASGEDSNAKGINGDETNNSADRAGAVYVFVRNGTTWSQQAYLKASNTSAGDGFGSGAAISGETLVIAATGQGGNATNINGIQSKNTATGSGAVYVFTRDGTTWTQEAFIKASETTTGDNFGSSLAISGNTIVVGAKSKSAAYVFERSDTTWAQQATLKASNSSRSDQFGWTVGISGDKIIVGARFEESNATGINGDQSNNSADAAGAVYVFVRDGMTWSQQTYLKASNTDAGDTFAKVAISGDTLVVAAETESSNAVGINGDQSDNSAEESGAVYVFESQSFTINSGLNDAWYNPLTDGQGFFVTVFPDIGKVFLSWFTYDTEFPAMNATANLGDPGHRWLTAFGSYADNQAVMNISITSGGIFDSDTDVENVEDGTIILTFEDCNSGTVEYDIPSINRQGTVTIQRIANDNIALCEAL